MDNWGNGYNVKQRPRITNKKIKMALEETNNSEGERSQLIS